MSDLTGFCNKCGHVGPVEADGKHPGCNYLAGIVGWRPIETAPKDGTRILTTMGEGFLVWAAAWTSERPPGEPKERWKRWGPRWERTGFFDYAYHPRFWQPLPAPPRESGE